MKNSILIICGPTATGKTSLGISLARKFNGEIISADSRQVYRGMDIGTGKGVSNFGFRISNLSWRDQPLGYFTNGVAKIWGYDLVDPNQEFSIAEYRRLMTPVIKQIQSQNKLPIIVGGTGFYIQALVNPPETVDIPLNQSLRNELEQLNLIDLQARLESIDSEKFESMNNSDRNNPRRLVRAIEVAMAVNEKSRGSQIIQPPRLENDVLWVGLKAEKGELRKMVEENVAKRIEQGFNEEIEQLEAGSFDWKSPAASATGYKEWKAYISNQLSKEEAINQWITREHQYQKRQLTWFHKQAQINWFDCHSPNLDSQVEAKIEAWYSS